MGNNADIPFNSFTVMQLNIDDEGVSYHVDVQFLITIDHINHPTVGFNTIRHIAKESSNVSFLNTLFEKAFNNSDISKIEAFVNLIQSQEQEKVVSVKKMRDVLLHLNQMIFQQEEVELPEVLECIDSVIMLKPGAKNYFQIPVSNSSKHDIVLKKNTIVGRAEYINSIIPLPVKFNSYKISVSSIHTKEKDECNPIKKSSEKQNQPEHQHQSTIKKEKIEAVPKATTEHQHKILPSIDFAGLT